MSFSKSSIQWQGSFAVMLLSILVSCGDSTSKTADRAPIDVSPESHGLHVVQNDQLRDIMDRLRELELGRMASQLDRTGEITPELKEAADLASKLASDAQLLPYTMKDEPMTDEARRVMAALSGKMQHEADGLVKAANNGDTKAAQARFDGLIQTCIDCHREFRAPAVAMKS